MTLWLTDPSELPTRFLSDPIRKVRTEDRRVDIVRPDGRPSENTAVGQRSRKTHFREWERADRREFDVRPARDQHAAQIKALIVEVAQQPEQEPNRANAARR